MASSDLPELLGNLRIDDAEAEPPRVYRAIRPDEDPSQGLQAKNPQVKYTITGHVRSGGRKNHNSQFISASKSPEALEKHRKGNRIVEINTAKAKAAGCRFLDVGGKDIDLINGQIGKNYAKKSEEVLFTGAAIPADAVQLVFDYDQPISTMTQPTSTTTQPTSTTTQPTSTTTQPISTMTQPISTMTQPISTMTQPTSTTTQPTSTTTQPISTTTQPISTMTQPISTITQPTSTMTQTTSTTTQPTSTTTQLISTTIEPTSTSTKPTSTATLPTLTTMSPTSTTKQPTSTTKQPTLTAKSTTSTTKQPTSCTKKPTSTTKPPTSTSKSPSSTTTQPISKIKNTKIEERDKIIANYQHKIDELFSEILELKTDQAKTATAMADLKSENVELHDKAEQYSKRESLRISGLNLIERERSDAAVCRLAQLLGVTIQESDISRSHFTNKDRTQIIVKFVSHQKRKELITVRNKLKNNTDIGRVFINEDLTKVRYQMFREMLKLKFDGKIFCTWTFDGTIFYKLSEGDDRKQISRYADIDQLRGYRPILQYRYRPILQYHV